MPNVSGIAEVNGAKLYYETAGEGHPLVLIHGGGLDRRMWDNQFHTFAQYYKVIRYDARGFGKSAVPEGPYQNTEDLYQLLKSLGINKVYLLGLSFGGGIAVDFTLVHAEMVDALIPVGSDLGGYNYSAEHIQKILAMFTAAQEEGPSRAIDVYLENPHLAPAQGDPAIRQKVREILLDNSHLFFMDPSFLLRLDPPAINRLAEIQAATLVIVGEQDDPNLHEIAKILETGIRGSRKIIIPGAAHLVNIEKPVEFNKVVLDFLRSVEREATK